MCIITLLISLGMLSWVTCWVWD